MTPLTKEALTDMYNQFAPAYPKHVHVTVQEITDQMVNLKMVVIETTTFVTSKKRTTVEFVEENYLVMQITQV